MTSGLYERTEKWKIKNKLAHNTPEAKEKHKQTAIKQYSDPEQIEKARKSHLGKQPNLGKKHSKEAKEKSSKTQKKKYQDPEYKEKHRQAQNKAWENPKSREKARKSAIKRIENHYGVCLPNYNPKACEYFLLFDEMYNTKGRYAVYGNGEYLIKELGYFPDYINFDLKLIIEYDEGHHFENGVLRERDVQRQQEIQKHFPDFEFFRIKE